MTKPFTWIEMTSPSKCMFSTCLTKHCKYFSIALIRAVPLAYKLKTFLCPSPCNILNKQCVAKKRNYYLTLKRSLNIRITCRGISK